MSNPVTRRFALFRIASAGAATAVASVPVAITAVQPKTAEDPVLLRLGRKAAKLDAICQRRKKAKAAALATFEALAPELPAELVVTSFSDGHFNSENNIWPSDPPNQRYHTANNLRLGVECWDEWGEDVPGDIHKARAYRDERLPIAERHEASLANAMERSGYNLASGAHFLACYALEEVVDRIAECQSRTPEGITIKAQVYDAWIRSGDDRATQFAAMTIGPGLAADVCRILSEGDEV